MITRLRVRPHMHLIFFSLVLIFAYNNCGQLPQATMESKILAADDVGSLFSGQITSKIEYVSRTGAVWGYALDPKNPTKTIKVTIYVDGPVGVGQLAGVTQANHAAFGLYEGHYFSYQLPAQFSDGRNHTVYIYGHEATPANELSPGPLTYVAYTPKAESFFNEKIRPYTQSNCTGCHQWTYSMLLTAGLLVPTPFDGGSATNNLLIKKMSGQSGHRGGAFCGNINEGFCTEIQNWWNAEFK